MSLYEHIFIARPDVSSQQVDTLVEEMKTFLEEKGAKFAKTESWGLRNLAYPIKKNRKGHYMLLCLEAEGQLIEELERRQRLHEDVLRYMTIRVEAFDEGPSPVLVRKEERRRRSEGSPSTQGQEVSSPPSDPSSSSVETKNV